ncbi:hypothetical protein QA601_18410 [Chitinispirillales bacterium ANBcel5]|uniref:hypothetical protein n=1 Tax=Cellulosispirillum alkaliphilum TaxID=3039283 RepID=UPI002A510BD7|nr:hypothetical protein [Chitinispirillales bacterium ANBcel5]
MTNKLLIKIIVFTICMMAINGYSHENDNDSVFITNCKNKELSNIISNAESWKLDFKDLKQLINRDCYIDSLKLREYLVHIFSNSIHQNIDSLSSSEKNLNVAAWRLLIIFPDMWGNDLEDILVKMNKIHSESNNMAGYYRNLSILVRRSDHWYDYMLEMLNCRDTILANERNSVIRGLLYRFEDCTDDETHEKIESILYALLKTGKAGLGALRNIDSYLESRSNAYKYSSQRLQLFLEGDKKLIEKIGSRALETTYYMYSQEVQNYLENKLLVEYDPPFAIENCTKE